MQYQHTRTMVRQMRNRTRRLRGIALLAALFITLVSLSYLGAIPAFAIPPEPIPEPPDNDPYLPPDVGFDWSRPSRVAVVPSARDSSIRVLTSSLANTLVRWPSTVRAVTNRCWAI